MAVMAGLTYSNCGVGRIAEAVDQVRGVLGQPPEALFAGAQGGLSRLALVALLLLLQGVGHRLPQARQAVLEQVIGRALLHDLHRHFLADAAGNHNEGDIQLALLEQVQGGQGVELRQGIIGDDQVQPGVQGPQVSRGGYPPAASRAVAGALELVHDQLGIRWTVFQDQHV